MNGTNNERVPLNLGSVKVHVRVGGVDSQIRRAQDLKAVTSQLWLALKQADEAGFDSLVTEIGRVHLEAVRLRHASTALGVA